MAVISNYVLFLRRVVLSLQAQSLAIWAREGPQWTRIYHAFLESSCANWVCCYDNLFVSVVRVSVCLSCFVFLVFFFSCVYSCYVSVCSSLRCVLIGVCVFVSLFFSCRFLFFFSLSLYLYLTRWVSLYLYLALSLCEYLFNVCVSCFLFLFVSGVVVHVCLLWLCSCVTFCQWASVSHSGSIIPYLWIYVCVSFSVIFIDLGSGGFWCVVLVCVVALCVCCWVRWIRIFNLVSEWKFWTLVNKCLQVFCQFLKKLVQKNVIDNWSTCKVSWTTGPS